MYEKIASGNNCFHWTDIAFQRAVTHDRCSELMLAMGQCMWPTVWIEKQQPGTTWPSTPGRSVSSFLLLTNINHWNKTSDHKWKCFYASSFCVSANRFTIHYYSKIWGQPIIKYFWKKSLLLTKVAFIWSII